jgi:hypothetical protein
VCGNHSDDEEIVYRRERKEGRVEKRHDKETGAPESQCQRIKPTDKRPHVDTEYAEHRPVITSRLPRILAASAFVIGAIAWFRFFQNDLVLSHYDAKAHLVVARRVIDSITPGWQQIGAVWLPLPHLIQILPTQIDMFYRTGAFGSLLSVACFSLTVWAAARLVVVITSSALGATAAAALLIANPNLLYLQSTPMTEPLLLAAVFLIVLRLYEWLEGPASASAPGAAADRNGGHAAAGPPEGGQYAPQSRLGWMLFAAAWTRYEAWLIIVAALAVSAWVLLVRGAGVRRALALTARLAAWPATAAVLFAANSRVTTGRWLVTGGFFEIDPTYHGLVTKSAIAVWWGTHRLSGYVVESVAIATAGWLFARSATCATASARLVPLALLAAAVLPFYGFLEGHPFRVRYMVVLAASCALLCGLAIGFVRRRSVRIALAFVLVVSQLIESAPWGLAAPMIEEAQWDVPRTIERRAVTACLRRDYHGDKILASMGSLAHYMQELSRDGFGIADFIHEGNGDLWRFALETGPAPHAGWMIVEEQSEGGDILAHRVREDVGFTRGMVRTCTGGGIALYRRQ